MNRLVTIALDTSALLSEAGMTVLIGFCVVFAALLLLTIVFWAFGAVARGKEQTDLQTPPIVPQSVQKPATVPVVEDGISEEIVAVIAAAVAAMSDGNKQYTVRRIRSARTNTRPVWAAAGIADNTQPF